MLATGRGPFLTYVGGPTALLEWGGLRLLTDPTFDPAGTAYPTAAYTLRKTLGPAVAAAALAPIDAVLLSHDHHFDNLDHAGRALLPHASLVLTTAAGAGRLGGAAVGLLPWDTFDFAAPGGRVLRVTATPARHGPAEADRGPVIGFALAWQDDPGTALYVSGDTVWYEGAAAVRARCSVRVALLFLGAAKVRVAGDRPLTFTAAEAVEAARAFGEATIVPLHFEGWEHFTESRRDIEAAFAAAGLAARLQWPLAGERVELRLAGAAPTASPDAIMR
jgi:L-ascorbate metabolism protein UlaG (beta-lactamase superfamily)